MVKRFRGAAVSGLLASILVAHAQAATAATTTTDVLNNFLTNFKITVNGESLSGLSAAQIASGLAANLQITPKANGQSVITLKNDVTVDIRTATSLTPVANLTLLASNFLWNPDPAVTYGISIRNLTNASQNYVYTWPLLFSSPLVGQTQVKSSLTGSLTDLGGTAGASLAPTSNPKIQSSIVGFSPTAPMGVDVGDPVSFATANATQNFAFYNPGPAPGAIYAAGPTGTGSGLTFMNVATTFSLSARDRVNMTGFAEILPVPEPSTYALMIVGLAFAGVVARRRASSQTK